jgi:hypothetical protein
MRDQCSDRHLVDKVVGIGNCSGDEVDKFKDFDLTPVPGTSGRAADRGMLRKFGMPDCRRPSDKSLQFLHSGSLEGPGGQGSEISSDAPLSGSGDFHHQRRRDKQAPKIHEVEGPAQFLR